MKENVLWSMPVAGRKDLAITQFQDRIEAETGLHFSDYDAFHRWSVQEPGQFWSQLWDFFGVVGDKNGEVLVGREDIVGAQFFPDAHLNFAENCLRRTGDEPAIFFRSETQETLTLSWDQLAAEVSIAQQLLRNKGVSIGDRVAAVMPNIPTTVVYFLATASLGAVWSSCSPDFGAGAIIDRFEQVEPKVLLWADGYTYKGKWHSVAEKISEVRCRLPSLSACIRIRFPGSVETELPEGCVNETRAREGLEATVAEFVRVPFNAPLLILFSSGTSGRPKCIVHSVGGTLLQHVKEHQLHSDLRPGDRLFYFSTCSWMMWNWLVSGLATGATIALFDGSPFYPNETALWHMAAELEITHFGTSPKYIDTLRKSGFAISDQIALPALRMILSTGSPLSETNFSYVYESLHSNVLLASIAGGTDIVSCFLLGCPTLPVRAGELQSAGLGMDVRIVDAEGREAEIGDLICGTPFPSRPIGFWGDEDGKRYRAAYFSTHDNVWCQHDRVERLKTGGYVVHGRSDATLNPGGVRIGTAEIYRALDGIPDVLDTVVVGRDVKDDVEVVLFVMLRDGSELTDAMIGDIKQKIRTRCTPRHVPSSIHSVPDIPRTRNGKTSEIAVKSVVNNCKVSNLEQLENPECLPKFVLHDPL